MYSIPWNLPYFCGFNSAFMFQTKIKISNVNNLTDARYFAAREVDYIGYSMNTAEQGISGTTIKAILEWVTGPAHILEVSIEQLADLAELHQRIQPAFIQIPAFVTSAEVELLPALPYIKEIVVAPDFTEEGLFEELLEWKNLPVVLDFSKNGHFWSDLKAQNRVSFLQKMLFGKEIWLDIPFEPEQWPELSTTLNPFGLSIKSSGEEKVGYKSFDEMDELLDTLSA